jgi:hypothetical protein
MDHMNRNNYITPNLRTELSGSGRVAPMTVNLGTHTPSPSTQPEPACGWEGDGGPSGDYFNVHGYQFYVPTHTNIHCLRWDWIPPPTVLPRFQGQLTTFVEQTLNDGKQVMRKVNQLKTSLA